MRAHRSSAAPGRVPSPTITLTIANEAQIPSRDLLPAERAIVDQSRQLAAAWGTPVVRFGADGATVLLDGGTDDVYAGWHQFVPGAPESIVIGATTGPSVTIQAQGPYAVVYVGDGAGGSWTVLLSHEIMEMLADPQADGIEVCDPVEGQTYRIDGVAVQAFVSPSFYASATSSSMRNVKATPPLAPPDS